MSGIKKRDIKMNNYPSNDKSKQISKYNDAALSISRLHESHLKCKQHMTGGNFELFKYELDIIWMELYPDVLRHSDKRTIVEKNKRLMKEISFVRNRNEFFFALMKRYEFLREVQDLAGKAGVYKEADEDNFE